MGTKTRVLNRFVGLRLSASVLKQIEVLCEKEKKSTSEVIREAITDRISADRNTKY